MRKYLSSITALLFLAPSLLAQSVGQAAPDFKYDSLDNDTISLSEYQGKVVFLFFFGYN